MIFEESPVRQDRIPVTLAQPVTVALSDGHVSLKFVGEFKRTQVLVRGTINRMMAHMMEFPLFLDSPALVLRAQRDLLSENIRLFG